MRDQGRSRHRHRHRLREPDGGGRGGGDAVTAGGRRVGLGAAARGGHADLLLRGNGPALLTDTESSFNIINPLGTAFALPLSAADAAGTDRIAFVTVDSPAALVNFETAGPAILAQAGVEYELVKVPRGTADMIVQMQQVVASGAGLVYITGNDAFCIAVLQGLQTVGYDGAVATVAQCITDASSCGPASAPPSPSRRAPSRLWDAAPPRSPSTTTSRTGSSS